MGNAVESLHHEKDPVAQAPQVSPADDHAPDGQDVAGGGVEANVGVLPPTGVETFGGSSSSDVVCEGPSHEPGLTVETDGCAKVDHAAPFHDSEFDAENQLLSSNAQELIVSQQGSDDADKTDVVMRKIEEVDDCEEREHSGKSVDDVKRRGADSKDEEMELMDQNPESWRCSTASTVTDASECYLTALEDSDKDDMCGTYSERSSAEIDDYGDIEDTLTVTLTDSNIRDEIRSKMFGGDAHLEKTLSEETVVETMDELKVDSTADETDACERDDANFAEKTLMSDSQVELDSGMELRIGDQSQDQNIDDYPVQHNVVATPPQVENEVNPESHQPQCQGLGVVEDSFELTKASGHSEKPSGDNNDECILPETVLCVEPIESGSLGDAFGINGTEQVMHREENTEIPSDVCITEDHSNEDIGLSSPGDMTAELHSESVCEDVKQPSCTQIGNNTDSDIVSNEAAYIDGSSDDINHDIRLEQCVDTALTVSGMNMPNVEVDDMNKEDDSAAGNYETSDDIHCKELSDSDAGFFPAQLSEANLGVLATCEGDVVDYGTTVPGEQPEESFSQAVKFSEDAEVFDGKKRDSLEESESPQLDEVDTEENTEQDERLKEEQDGDDDNQTAVSLWRNMLATLQPQGLTTEEIAEQEERLKEEHGGDDDNQTAVSLWHDMLASLQAQGLITQEQISHAMTTDLTDLEADKEVEEGEEELDEPEPGDAVRSEATCLSDVVNLAMSEEEKEKEEEELEEPEPDYSLSSDDERARTSPEISTEMKSGEDTSVSPVPDLLSSSPSADAGEEGFPNVALMALVKPASVVLDQRLDQTSTTDQPENVDSTSEDLPAKAATETDVIIAVTDVIVVDDDDDNERIGHFQRRTSVRPSKRSRSGNWPKRSTSSISSLVPELPEEGDMEPGVSEDAVGSESVFTHIETPHPARLNPWTNLKSMPEEIDSRGDGMRVVKARNVTYERKNAVKLHKLEAFTDETEWKPYSVVLHKEAAGFGIKLSHHEVPVAIRAVDENGVAAKHGVRVEDRISKVNGTSVFRNSYTEVAEKIRSSGQDVRLELLRHSSKAGTVPMTPSLPEFATSKPLKSTTSLPARNINEHHPLKHSKTTAQSHFTASSDNLVDKPFTDPNFLKQKPAHLAMFLRFLLDEDDPYPMFFSLLCDYYQQNLRDPINSTRRWAYEIYSTFLEAKAPMKLSVDARLVAPVDRVMKELGRAKDHELRTLFHQIHGVIKGNIIRQLNNFVERKLLSNNPEYHLLRMNLDRATEFQIIDKALWKNFEHCLAQDHDDAKRAVAYSLATFFRQVGFSGVRNSNLLENCPTFLSNDKKALKNKMKKLYSNKGHQLSPCQFTTLTHCHACQKVIWGLGHQAYECSNCDMNFHQRCAEINIDVCTGSKSKESKRTVRNMIHGRRLPTLTGREDVHKISPQSDVQRIQSMREQSEGQVTKSSVLETVYERPGQRPFHTSDDSDLEVDSELPELTDFISKEDLRQMKDKERKRQQIINELFHTERLHVRSLKVMNKVFLQPMLDDPAIDQEFINLLFPNLQELIQIHDSMNKEFIARRKQKKVVNDIGQHLVNKFSGPDGEKLKSACARFCADQGFALETLKMRQRKDLKLSTFLKEAATSPLCKRLELKDFLPRQMSRLTKYPLLIESLKKCTPATSEDSACLSEALRLTKGLLEHVNQEAKRVQNNRHLIDMQQRLDQRAVDSSVHPVLREYKNFDLTKHTLVYDGGVTWQPLHARSRPIDVHMVLFEEFLVVLQKQDDRLLLRCSSTTVEDRKFQYCPILKLARLMVKDVATDRRAFFLLDSTANSPQVYEFLAHSREEKNKWCNHIQETVRRHVVRNASQTTSTATPAGGHALESKPQTIGMFGHSKAFSSPSHDTVDHSGEKPVALSDEKNGDSIDKVNENFIADDSVDSSGDWIETKEKKVKRLKELNLLISRLMREKYELSTGTQMMASDGDDDEFSVDGAGDNAQTIIKKLVKRVTRLRELVSSEQPQSEYASGETFNEETISLPAEKILEHDAAIQQLMVHLVDKVMTNDEEFEILEQECQSMLKSMNMMGDSFSSIHPDEILSNDPFGLCMMEEGAFLSVRSQVFKESTSDNLFDLNENIDSDSTL